ncbi:MAG: hypothetical protein QNL62_06955 [Gammaproteobacteria bacterium]|nr:hypothetical protein [Gammaproteobacteria bacterium]
MSQLTTFKVITVLVTCFSVVLFANANTIEPGNPQPTTSTKQVSETLPTTPTGSRGQLLYENHCIACHDSRAYIREKRKSRSVTDIEKWVFQWAQQINLDWNRADINDVTEYLNQRFYQFPDENIDNR